MYIISISIYIYIYYIYIYIYIHHILLNVSIAFFRKLQFQALCSLQLGPATQLPGSKEKRWSTAQHQAVENLGLLRSDTHSMFSPCNDYLLGGLEHDCYFSSIFWGIIIPTDELIFFRGVETTNQLQCDIYLGSVSRHDLIRRANNASSQPGTQGFHWILRSPCLQKS